MTEVLNFTAFCQNMSIYENGHDGQLLWIEMKIIFFL